MDTPPRTDQSQGKLGCHHAHLATVPSSRFAALVQLVFVFTAFVLIVFFRRSPEFGSLGITFVAIFLEALPFMLLGSLIGGFIEVFVSKAALTRVLPKRTGRAIFAAAGLGLIFPVCECAIVPVVRRLFQKGLPLGAGIAFLLGGPIVNPIVAISTAVAYGYDWSTAFSRVFIGYLIAVTIGGLVEWRFNKQTALAEDALAAHGNNDAPFLGGICPQSIPFFTKLARTFQHAATDFLDIGRYLIFGAFIAGVLQTVIARGDLAAVSSSPLGSVLSMMFLAILLNLCSEADAFVAASFRTTLPMVAQMAFMVLGPMLDIKLLLMYLRIFKKRFIVVLATLTVLFVFLSMLLIHWKG